jgi:purine-binding chemotaxis protein CheW
MRAEFDAAFAQPPPPADTELEDVLALRLGDDRCVLRLSDIARMAASPPLTAVPTPAPALLGITSHHGAVIAAYDLAILLGRPPSQPRWLVIAKGEPSLGVTFEHFDGYQRIRRSSTDSLLLVQMPTIVGIVRALTQNSQHLQARNPQYRSGD